MGGNTATLIPEQTEVADSRSGSKWVNIYVLMEKTWKEYRDQTSSALPPKAVDRVSQLILMNLNIHSVLAWRGWKWIEHESPVDNFWINPEKQAEEVFVRFVDLEKAIKSNTEILKELNHFAGGRFTELLSGARLKTPELTNEKLKYYEYRYKKPADSGAVSRGLRAAIAKGLTPRSDIEGPTINGLPGWDGWGPPTL